MGKVGDTVVLDGGTISLNNNLNNTDFGVFYKSGGGVSNYEQLSNKPSINGVIVLGDKLGEDYNLQDLMDEITPQEIDNIIYG